jgi:hypothetical protein
MGDILRPLWSTSTIRGEEIKQQKRIILIPTNGIMKMKQIFRTNVLIQGKYKTNARNVVRLIEMSK